MTKTLLQRIATAISTAPQGETYEDCRNNEAKAVLLEIANWIEDERILFMTPYGLRIICQTKDKAGKQMTERAQKIMDAYGKVLEKSVWYNEECVVSVLQHLIDEHSEVRGTGRVDKKSQVVSVKTLMKLIEELK
jgi:hypothetical protein